MVTSQVEIRDLLCPYKAKNCSSCQIYSSLFVTDVSFYHEVHYKRAILDSPFHFVMRRTRNPCRQLNSEGIKGAALCYLSPIISNKCSIISAKCVCNVRCHGLETAWLNVCRTRDTCDKALLGKPQMKLL